MGESANIIRELADRHLQSVVSLSVQWKDPFQPGRRPITSSATGSIIHACNDFILIQTCSHTFRPFTVCHGPGFDSVEILNGSTFLKVGFFDGFEAWGEAYCIDWSKDVCLVLVPFPSKSSYEPVKFIDYEEDIITGQSVYRRGTKVYSIFCFPTGQKEGNLLFGTATEGDICGHDNLTGNDLAPTNFRSDLRLFELDMAGAGGCSGGPVFNSDFLVMGMQLAKVVDLRFAAKLDQIRQWANTVLDIPTARTMNETVAGASFLISEELREVRSMV